MDPEHFLSLQQTSIAILQTQQGILQTLLLIANAIELLSGKQPVALGSVASMICPWCQGNGRYQDGETCAPCNGTGRKV